MDPEAEQCKKVFALYGLAMYQAQCLERQIAISLASTFGPEGITRKQYDSLLESNFEKTMGRLIHEFVGANKSDARARCFEADLRRGRALLERMRAAFADVPEDELLEEAVRTVRQVRTEERRTRPRADAQ